MLTLNPTISYWRDEIGTIRFVSVSTFISYQHCIMKGYVAVYRVWMKLEILSRRVFGRVVFLPQRGVVTRTFPWSWKASNNETMEPIILWDSEKTVYNVTPAACTVFAISDSQHCSSRQRVKSDSRCGLRGTNGRQWWEIALMRYLHADMSNVYNHRYIYFILGLEIHGGNVILAKRLQNGEPRTPFSYECRPIKAASDKSSPRL